MVNRVKLGFWGAEQLSVQQLWVGSDGQLEAGVDTDRVSLVAGSLIRAAPLMENYGNRS